MAVTIVGAPKRASVTVEQPTVNVGTAVSSAQINNIVDQLALGGVHITTLTAASAAADTTLEVTDASGFAVGDYITINLNSGSIHTSTIDSIASNIVTIADGIPAGETAGIGNVVSSTIEEVRAARLAGNATSVLSLADRVEIAANNEYNVLAYGAVGDGATDDSAAVQAAATAAGNAATANRPTTLIFPSGHQFYTGTANITVAENVSVIMHGMMISAASGVALTIGSVSQRNRQTKHKIMLKRNSTSWASSSDVGVRVTNLEYGQLTLTWVSGFYTNVQLYGHTTGFVYNHIFPVAVLDGVVNLDMFSESGGWVNQNVLTGGALRVNASTHTAQGGTTSVIGAKLHGNDCNNNVFLGTNFELNDSYTTGSAMPVELDDESRDNYFLGVRNESNDPDYFAREKGTARFNYFDLAYVNVGGGTGIERTNDGTGARARSPIVRNKDRVISFPALVFNSGPVHKNACYYNGSTNLNIPNVHIISSSNGTAHTNQSSLVLNSDYVEFANSQRGLGVYIDTRTCKRFTIKKDVESGFGGRLIVRPFNSSDAIITSTDDAYTVLTYTGALSYSTAYGGAWTETSDSDEAHFFEVSSSTQYIAVGLVGSSDAALRVRSFAVYNHDSGHASAWAGYQEIVKGANIGSAAPTAGTWEQGRIVYDASPVAGGRTYWICTTAGTPGTWKKAGDIVS